ncbi:MAG: hypothetical protein RLZZ176_3343 [Cyanobacteriota bacterium]
MNESQAEMEEFIDCSFCGADELEQDLQDLIVHSETSDTQEDINSPWVICEGRQYAVEGFTFREEKETSMQRCYEVFRDGKFLTFVFAHTAKRGYLRWKYLGDDYADIPSLMSAICCERGSSRIFSFC